MRRTSDTGPSSAQRALVRVRDGGLCVMCGAPGTNDHHRQGRGMGGRKGGARVETNGPAWRLTLCGSGTSGCHGLVTSPAAFGATLDTVRGKGYVLRRNGPPVDAALVPVLTFRGWELFGHDGGRAACVPPGADGA